MVKMMKMKKMININDDITVSGVVIECEGDMVVFRTRSGDIKVVNVADIKTIHPYKKPSDVDFRKGN